VHSREISLADGAVLVPILAVIGLLSFYPQLALHRSEASVKQALATPVTPAYAAQAPCPSAPRVRQAPGAAQETVACNVDVEHKQ
jgi:hypothetical protein